MIYKTLNSTNVALYFYVPHKIDRFETTIDARNFATYEIKYAYSYDNSAWTDYFTIEEAKTAFVDLENIYVKAIVLAIKGGGLEQCIFRLNVEVNDYFITRPERMEILHDSNILIRSKTSNLYNPYEISPNAKVLQDTLSRSVSDIWGFDVFWFKAVHDDEKSSRTFREYDFAESMQYREVRLVVKNNYIPDNRTRFAEFDIDFEDELEVHIDKVEWAKVFGEDNPPTSDDYFFFPLTNQMYIINAPYKEKNFMQNTPFWKMMCVKYERRSSTITDDFVNDEIDELIDFTDDYKKDQYQDEKDDAIGKGTIQPDDDSKYNISECHFEFNGTRIFGYHYNYENMPSTSIAKEYSFEPKNNEFTFMGWFKLNKNTKQFIDSDSFKIGLQNNRLVLQLLVNNIVGEANHTMNVEINEDEWVAIVVSTNQNTTTVSLVECNMKVIDSFEVSYALSPTTFINILGNVSFANIRVNKRRLIKNPPLTFKTKLVEEIASHKENYVIDNAVPSLTEPKLPTDGKAL